MDFVIETLKLVFNGDDVIIDSVRFLVVLLISFVPNLIGAVMVQFYRIKSNKYAAFNWNVLIISTITGSIILSAFSHLQFAWLTIQVRFLVGFILGIIGDEIFEKFTSLQSITKMLSDFNDFRSGRRIGEHQIQPNNVTVTSNENNTQQVIIQNEEKVGE